MQTLLIPVNLYVSSGSGYLSFTDDRDEIFHNGKINNMSFNDIYTKFKNCELLVKLDIADEYNSNYHRVINISNILYNRRTSTVTEDLPNNKYRDNTTLTENIIFEITPNLNAYDYGLFPEVDDPGYVDTSYVEYSISGNSTPELSFFHCEVLEYGIIYDAPPMK